MKEKQKMLKVDETTHTMLKSQAATAGRSMKEYLKLCLISCKSQAGTKC